MSNKRKEIDSEHSINNSNSPKHRKISNFDFSSEEIRKKQIQEFRDKFYNDNITISEIQEFCKTIKDSDKIIDKEQEILKDIYDRYYENKNSISGKSTNNSSKYDKDEIDHFEIRKISESNKCLSIRLKNGKDIPMSIHNLKKVPGSISINKKSIQQAFRNRIEYQIEPYRNSGKEIIYNQSFTKIVGNFYKNYPFDLKKFNVKSINKYHFIDEDDEYSKSIGEKWADYHKNLIDNGDIKFEYIMKEIK